MDNDIRDLRLLQLRRAVQQAALPADEQIGVLKGFDVPFEVADDFGNWCRWALVSADVSLTDEQRGSLMSLDRCLDEMSGEHNADLWTEDALRSRAEWDDVRRQARRVLELFHWSLDDRRAESQ